MNRAATSALVLELDSLQYSLHEGPCVDSLDGAEVVIAPRIAHDDRWPNYVPSAVPRGLKSQLAVRLHLASEGTVGGLNLYSTTDVDVADEDVIVAGLFATHAAAALGSARRNQTLDAAVESRQTVGQALGIVMERYQIDDTTAQAFLWRASSHTNTKVRDIAASLIADHNENVERPKQ